MFKNTKGQEKGITLIALVITVIVLLILAGISISMLSGDNSILNKAGQARDITGQRDIEERIQIAYLGAMTNGEGSFSRGKFVEELDKTFGEGKYTLSTDGSTLTIDGKEYETGVPEKWSKSEKEALQTNGISEITGDAITNDNLKNNDKIKAVLTGEVPLTTEMTYVTGTKDTGVVVSIDNSEFVWVPVPVAIWDGTTTITSGTYTPMAKLQSNGTDYEGLLYEFSGTTATYKSDWNVSTTNYREPAFLTGMEDNDGYISYVAGQGITSPIPSENELKTGYKSVVQSVQKYGGFYVGRYELGLEGTKPVSKPASATITTADASQEATKSWYGLYSKCKSFSATNLTSTMMWGSQYDAMMNWMAKTGKPVGTANSEKYNQEQTTGSKVEDILNNVKDLYGCHYEWTLEADLTSYRVDRGGNFSNSLSPSLRSSGYYYPYITDANNGSRLSLYINV